MEDEPVRGETFSTQWHKEVKEGTKRGAGATNGAV